MSSWYKRYLGDRSITEGMSWAQRGIVQAFFDDAWVYPDGAYGIPIDLATWAQSKGIAAADWDALWPRLAPHVTQLPTGRWAPIRQAQDRAKMDAALEQQRAGGRQGAERRWRSAALTLVPPPADPPKKAPKRPVDASDGFAEWWAGYPKKVAKPHAQAAWRALAPNAALQATLKEAVARQAATEDWTKEKGRFIPNPATWLRARRWEDAPTVLPEAPAAVAYVRDCQHTPRCTDVIAHTRLFMLGMVAGGSQ